MVQKAILHNLVEALDDDDTDMLYNLLVRLAPVDTPLPDEVNAYKNAIADIENGDISRLDDINWDV